MAVVRSQVIPPGVYWVDSFPVARPGFNQWRQQNSSLVKVVSAALHMDEKPAREWVLFEVLFPVVWDARFGFPTVAPKGKATTEDDTRDGGGPSAPFDFGSLFGGGAGTLLLGLLLYELIGSSRR